MTACYSCKKPMLQVAQIGRYNAFVCDQCPTVWRVEHRFWPCGFDHKRLEVVKHADRAGRMTVRHQCAECGMLVGPVIPKAQFDLNDLPPADVAKLARSEGDNDEYNQARAACDVAMSQIRNDSQAQRQAAYQAYLQSSEWRDRRDRVLARDSHVCQACLRAKATEVHHTTYRYIFNEPLFTLVSVCRPCHEAITRIDQQSRPRE